MALGIMAAALPMVASALLSGMLENELAVKATMSMLTGDNALAILRTRARDGDFPPNWGVGALELTDTDRIHAGSPPVIHEEDCVYSPFGEKRTFAFAILGQRMKANANDFRFVVMVYRKLDETATLDSAKVTFESDGTVDEDDTATFVKLKPLAGAVFKAELLSYQVVRMSLNPRPRP